MGKVLKAVAVIAVAAAIAYFAPQLAPQLLQALGTATATAAATAAATAVITAGLTIAATAAFSLLAPRPTAAAPGRQPSASQPQTREGIEWNYPPLPAWKSMSPRPQRWWRNEIFWPGQRFGVTRTHGDCMRGAMPTGLGWLVVDRFAPIREGDFVVFRPDDLWSYMRAGHSVLASLMADGLVKRFLGVDPDRRVMVFETTFPPQRLETGLDRIIYAYRIESHHRSWLAAHRARRRLDRAAPTYA